MQSPLEIAAGLDRCCPYSRDGRLLFCPRCGTEMPAGALSCSSCDWQEAIQSPSLEDDPAMRVLMPVGRSALAIIAGYLGLLSPIIIPAPFAILFGVLALRDIKQNPKKGGRGRAIFAIVMGSIFTLFPCLITLAGVLADR